MGDLVLDLTRVCAGIEYFHCDSLAVSTDDHLDVVCNKSGIPLTLGCSNLLATASPQPPQNLVTDA